ncbi:hypothetical protein L1887_27406 [Cichorium endivia]|nr:hypothetical protein L1887_27406 [Cichorium endivia]
MSSSSRRSVLPTQPPPDEPDNAVVAYLHQRRHPTDLFQPRRQRPAPALSPTSLTPLTAYYRGAMDIRNWIRKIEQHASDNVNKILGGNKADMDESKRAIPTSKGQALANEYGLLNQLFVM